MAGAAVAVIVRRARQDIVRHFLGQGATTPERAVAYDPDDDGPPLRVRRRLFRRLRDFGAVREPRPGLFYLDEDQLESFRWSERKRVVGVLALATAAVGVIVALA